MESKKLILRPLVALAMCWSNTLLAVDLTNYFNFDGYLLDASSNPIVGPVAVKFQIYDPAVGCLLFEETHATVSPALDGAISLKVGSGSRVSSGVDGGLSWKVIFHNDSQLRSSSTNCIPGYTPGPNDSRKLRVTVGATVLSPDYVMSAVPMATVAESLQGKIPSDFMAATPYSLPAVDGSANQVMQTDGSGNLSWMTPSSGGITSLNGSASSSQSFSNGTSGSAPNFTLAGSVHSLNIPMANTTSVTAGLISKAEFDSFNNKMDSVGATMTGYLTLSADPSSNMHAATKQYVDAAVGAVSAVSSSLVSGKMYVGSASNVATAVAPSGDVSMSNTGVFTVNNISDSSITSSKIADGTIVNADIGNVNIDKITGGSGYLNYLPGGSACPDGNLLKWNMAMSRWECSGILPFLPIDGSTPMTGPLNLQPASSVNFGGISTSVSESAGDLALVTSNNPSVMVKASGHVGIGTTAPSALLDVYGDGVIPTMKIGNSTNPGSPIMVVKQFANISCSGSFVVGTNVTTAKSCVFNISGTFSPTDNLSVVCHPSTVPPDVIQHSCYLSAANQVTIVVQNLNTAGATIPTAWDITLTKFQ